MGKKKKDKNITIRDADFYNPDKNLRKTLDYFDVKGAGGYGKPSARGTGDDQRRSADDVKADLKRAKASHYAFNRGLEASAMSGDKKSKSLMKSGMGNVGGIMRGVKHLGKLKKDNFGGGGMNGGQNQSALAYDLVKHDREKFIEDNDNKYASKDDLKKHKAKTVDEQVQEAEYVPSDRIKAAKERVAAHKEGVTTYGDGNEQRNEAADSFGKYKLNLSTMR